MNSGDGDGQGGLASCDSWGCKESDTTEQLNLTEFEKSQKRIYLAKNSGTVCFSIFFSSNVIKAIIL